jgi:hypothetical protein
MDWAAFGLSGRRTNDSCRANDSNDRRFGNNAVAKIQYESAAAVPTGTDTPAASLSLSTSMPGGRLLAGRMGPLRGRGGGGRMVWEPRRGPPQVGRDARTGAASVARYECKRVVRGGRRGGGRRRGLHRGMALPWLSQATRTVDLRSPAVRPTLAGHGDLTAAARRRPTGRGTLSTSRRGELSTPPLSFSPAWTDRRTAPAVRVVVRLFSEKQAGQSPHSPLCLQSSICR